MMSIHIVTCVKTGDIQAETKTLSTWQLRRVDNMLISRLSMLLCHCQFYLDNCLPSQLLHHLVNIAVRTERSALWITGRPA